MDENLEQNWVQVLEEIGQWAVSVRSSILPRGGLKNIMQTLSSQWRITRAVRMTNNVFNKTHFIDLSIFCICAMLVRLLCQAINVRCLINIFSILIMG